MKKLEKYTADLEEKIHSTPLPEYSPIPKDAEIPDDFDIDSFEASIPNRMDPYMAAEKAQTTINDK